MGALPEAYSILPEFTGTLPDTAVVGYSLCGAMRSGGVAEAYAVSPEFTGTLPEEAQHGE